MFLSGLVWNIRQPDITFHNTFVKILIEKVKIACKGPGCGTYCCFFKNVSNCLTRGHSIITLSQNAQNLDPSLVCNC